MKLSDRFSKSLKPIVNNLPTIIINVVIGVVVTGFICQQAYKIGNTFVVGWIAGSAAGTIVAMMTFDLITRIEKQKN